MPNTVVMAERDARRFRALQADVQACLAMNRVMLHALVALSPVSGKAADAMLEQEAEKAGEQVAEILEDVRGSLRRPQAEARLTRSLQQALIDAAEALEPLRACG